MRHKKFLFNVIVLLAVGLTELHAQNIILTESTGTKSTYALNKVRNISFSTSKLILTKTDNNGHSFTLTNLQNIQFNNQPTNLSEQKIKPKNVKLYPNPVQNIINFDLGEHYAENSTISILNLEGRLMLSQKVNSPGIFTIDVKSLPQGIYICRYNTQNPRSIKFNKY